MELSEPELRGHKNIFPPDTAVLVVKPFRELGADLLFVLVTSSTVDMTLLRLGLLLEDWL